MATTFTINGFKFDMTSEVSFGGGLAVGKIKPAITKALSFLPGSTAGKCDRFYADVFDLVGSGTLVLDLDAGTLTDPLGAIQATWARLLAWAVVLDAAPAAASLIIGGGTAPLGLFDTAATALTIYNGTGGAWAGAGGGEPGKVVTATTADKITLTNGDAGLHAIGAICLIGRSA